MAIQAPVVRTVEYDPTNPRHRMMNAQTDMIQIAAGLARDGRQEQGKKLRDAVDESKRAMDGLCAAYRARILALIEEERARIVKAAWYDTNSRVFTLDRIKEQIEGLT